VSRHTANERAPPADRPRTGTVTGGTVCPRPAQPGTVARRDSRESRSASVTMRLSAETTPPGWAAAGPSLGFALVKLPWATGARAYAASVGPENRWLLDQPTRTSPDCEWGEPRGRDWGKGSGVCIEQGCLSVASTYLSSVTSVGHMPPRRTCEILSELARGECGSTPRGAGGGQVDAVADTSGTADGPPCSA